MRIKEPLKFLRKLLKKETPAKAELTLQDGTIISLELGTGLVVVNREDTIVEKLLEKYQDKSFDLETSHILTIPDGWLFDIHVGLQSKEHDSMLLNPEAWCVGNREGTIVEQMEIAATKKDTEWLFGNSNTQNLKKLYKEDDTAKEENPAPNDEKDDSTRKEELRAVIIEELKLKAEEMKRNSKFEESLQAMVDEVPEASGLNGDKVDFEKLATEFEPKLEEREVQVVQYVRYVKPFVENAAFFGGLIVKFPNVGGSYIHVMITDVTAGLGYIGSELQQYFVLSLQHDIYKFTLRVSLVQNELLLTLLESEEFLTSVYATGIQDKRKFSVGEPLELNLLNTLYRNKLLLQTTISSEQVYAVLTETNGGGVTPNWDICIPVVLKDEGPTFLTLDGLIEYNTTTNQLIHLPYKRFNDISDDPLYRKLKREHKELKKRLTSDLPKPDSRTKSIILVKNEDNK